MEISILITVRNDLENIESLIPSIKQFSGQVEIVIVDAYSTDGTYEFLESQRENLHLVLNRKEGNRAVGRNACIDASTGSRLLFLDADTEVPSQWFSTLKKYLDKDVISGKIIQVGKANWSDLERVPMMYNGKDVTFPTNNYIVSRKVIDQVGKFDERFNTAEDIDLNIRIIDAGYEIFYAEDLVIYHRPRETLSALLRQSYNDGIGRKLLNQKYGIKSSVNTTNLKRHPLVELTRLAAGMMGYLKGG